MVGEWRGSVTLDGEWRRAVASMTLKHSSGANEGNELDIDSNADHSRN